MYDNLITSIADYLDPQSMHNLGLTRKTMHGIINLPSAYYSNHHLSKEQLFIKKYQYDHLLINIELELNDLMNMYPILNVSINGELPKIIDFVKQHPDI